MQHPTKVTVCDPDGIIIKLSAPDNPSRYAALGFHQSSTNERIYIYKNNDKSAICHIAEKLRDIGVPFSTHRHMGADYQVQLMRDRGLVSGKFKRLQNLGSDSDNNAPFRIDEF